jgi:hypothetical protein
MHLFEKNDKRISFVHVPKTGGLSIVNFLSKNGFEPIYNEKNYNGVHTPFEVLKNLQLDYDFCFSIFRDPIDRFVSALNYFYPSIQDYDQFIFQEIKKFNNLNDNINSLLFRQQVKYYPPDCKIIKFEKIEFLKIILKNNIFLDGDLENFNQQKKKKNKLSDDTIKLLKIHFNEDYDLKNNFIFSDL